MPDRTPPLQGPQLFAQLCGGARPRPQLDPGLVEPIRTRLEEAAAGASRLPAGVVVRVSKQAVERVRRCEARHLAELAAPRRLPGADLLRGRLLDAVFRLVVTTGALGGDPVATAVAACAAEGDDVAAGLAGLDPDERARVVAEVVERAGTLVERWPAIPATANPRTQERSSAVLAGGRVVLSTRPDLTFGRVIPAGSRVCLVEAKSGHLRPSHHHDLRFYALVEALRWGTPPLCASTYALADGRVASLVPDEAELFAAAETAADAIRRLVRLAAGAEPGRQANPLCPSCPLIGSCPEGARQVALSHGDPARNGAGRDTSDGGEAA